MVAVAIVFVVVFTLVNGLSVAMDLLDFLADRAERRQDCGEEAV